MPHNLDILFERLMQFDEVTILELLDITTEDLLTKFRSRVYNKRAFLCGEVEIYNIDDPELEDEDEMDGYQVEDDESEYD